MKKLQSYMMRQILVSTLFTTAVIACVIFLIRSLKLLKVVINQGIPFSEYIYMAITMLPNSVAMILPITISIATINTYTRLIQESELVAMQGAGFSPKQLAKPALYAGGLAFFIGIFLYAYLVPVSFQDYRERYADARVKYFTGLIQEGQFATLNENMTFFIRERTPDGQMKKIMLNDRRNRQLETTIFANSGEIILTDDGAIFQFKNGFQQYFQGKNLHVINFDTYQIQFQANTPESRLTNAYELTLPELAKIIWSNDAIETLENADRARGIFHQALTTPALAITLSLLGVLMLITTPFSRHTMSLVLLKTSLLIALFIILNFAMKSLSYRYDGIIPVMYALAYIPPVILWGVLVQHSQEKTSLNIRENS